ncbi:hypothetical protein LEP1GSC195_2088 [Leptospira wolbachii serovar Codice str. CDC]|uniref:Uncharacterized protein n=1 Tax=Leptospira wolbachii serovar Codice str. CDC TaxID=1218599 RepID=R9A222_9LEPT|nr:hypothetical protein LEP1GSC195_2088 [Leptospira wolbachii serovar Codice str. CDC]
MGTSGLDLGLGRKVKGFPKWRTFGKLLPKSSTMSQKKYVHKEKLAPRITDLKKIIQATVF